MLSGYRSPETETVDALDELLQFVFAGPLFNVSDYYDIECASGAYL